MKNTTHLILGMLALTFGMEAKAQIQLPSVFSDGMVLQQNSKVAVWGWGNPSETLMILSGWNPGDTVRTVVDNQGRWKAEVPTGCLNSFNFCLFFRQNLRLFPQNRKFYF